MPIERVATTAHMKGLQVWIAVCMPNIQRPLLPDVVEWPFARALGDKDCFLIRVDL